jgi:predicted nucleotidyltransferase
VKVVFRTAKDLTPEEIREYQKFSKKREKKEKEYLLQRYQEAWSVAKKAAKLLYNKYHAKKIAIFGSLKDPFCFNKWSDIDLAVWGIPPEM